MASASVLPCGGLCIRVAGRGQEHVEDFLRQHVFNPAHTHASDSARRWRIARLGHGLWLRANLHL